MSVAVTGAPGFSAAAIIFCECGNQMDQNDSTGARYCSNPSCVRRGTLYRVDVDLVPLEEYES